MIFQIVVIMAVLDQISGLAGNCLIVQNKGGGHGTIGYYLCKSLLQKNPGLKVSVLQDKMNAKKAPFSSYSDLTALGVNIIDVPLTGDGSLETPSAEILSQKYNFIIDNWSKSTVNASFVLDIAKASQSEQYVFISSGGMYKSDSPMPLSESAGVKTNDAREIEIAVEGSGVKHTFLRPQYIYGPKSNKRYLDYFIGRACRNLPIPVPGNGEQLLSLTHVEDVANLIAATVGNSKAYGEVFNCGTDKFISYKALTNLVKAQYGAAASDSNFLFYDPKAFKKAEFPFRAETFIVGCDKAKSVLGWAPKYCIEDDLAADIAEYVAAGSDKAQWGDKETAFDKEVAASLAK